MNGLPAPSSLAWRAAVALVAAAGTVHFLGPWLLESLIPVVHHLLGALSSDFRVTEISVVDSASLRSLEVRANLARPFEINGHTAMPFGSAGQPEGWFQINMTVGGMLLASAWTLLLALVWPAATRREYVVRFVRSLPVALALLLVQIPIVVIAELEAPLLAEMSPRSLSPMMVVSRFLMGGGGFVIATCLAAGVIGWGSASAPPAVASPGHSGTSPRF